MKTLPEEYKLLKKIGDILNKYMETPNLPLEIRSTELYYQVKKNLELKEQFPTQKEFNQFLRQFAKEPKVINSFISCRVDTSNHNHYEWFFSAMPKKKKEIQKAKSYDGTYNYYKHSKNKIASDGTKLSSYQEVFIYESLIRTKGIEIYIEYPLEFFKEKKYPDFTIKNTRNNKIYYWEHLGMMVSELYRDNMVNKVEWYKNNGLRTIENGGELIYTIYENENDFIKSVNKYIELIS